MIRGRQVLSNGDGFNLTTGGTKTAWRYGILAIMTGIVEPVGGTSVKYPPKMTVVTRQPDRVKVNSQSMSILYINTAVTDFTSSATAAVAAAAAATAAAATRTRRTTRITTTTTSPTIKATMTATSSKNNDNNKY
ncbi:hypothetical protein PoB_000397000 [Plakobranchus ocellatus]|uniref:Uncharacterized protein n=1 Tax=Plakobranchus ocellatus TaxID=259542 RepID=A0AAV3Y358_9GAST|nr:hypothetical protein PoB_000397000 [Plakobranchus ocellatus]